MKRAIATAVLALITLSQLPAKTDGCYIPTAKEWKQRREKSLINEPDQKAFIFFNKGQEQLIISPSYSGSATDFAWVVPVPSRPKVEILQGAPFHELARVVQPEPPRYLPGGAASDAKGGRAPGVTVIERKTIGDYDVSVLSATDSQALTYWLRNNEYHLPPSAERPIQAYIKEGWTFVASKIKLHDKATGLKTGTLTPLRLIFDSASPIYPMRLSSANPGEFSLLVYIAMPLDENANKGPFTLTTIKAPGDTRNNLERAILPKAAKSSYPTLSKLSKTGMQIYWMKTTFRATDCDRDYVWASTTR